jgi:glutathione S-transferase
LLTLVNGHLANKTYLVGNALTLADLRLWFALKLYFQLVLPDGYRKSIANVANWFNTVANNEHVVKVNLINNIIGTWKNSFMQKSTKSSKKRRT